MRAELPVTSQKKSPRSTWVFGSILSAMVVALTLLTLKAGLRIVGYGKPDQRRDPFFGFDGAPPIYSVSEDPGQQRRYVPRQNMRDITKTFLVKKPPGMFRVFVFGGSTTYGQPYGNDGGFPYFLEQELRAFYPDRQIEVINCGVKGFGSSRVLRILEEMVNYEPDLFIVYMGQNEYRDAKFHHQEIHRSPFIAALMSAMFESRAVYFLYEHYLVLEGMAFGPRVTSKGASRIKSILSAQDPRRGFVSRDYYATPKFVPKDSRAKQDKVSTKAMSEKDVEANFQSNVEQQIKLANQHGIKIVLLEIASNFKVSNLIKPDTIKLPSEFFAGFQKEKWFGLYQSGTNFLKQGEYKKAVASLEDAERMLEEHQSYTLKLLLGEAYEGLGLYGRARKMYQRRASAKKQRINQIITATGRRHSVPVLDVQALFGDNARNGIVGYENYFVDSVHMSLEGYRLIARALASELMSNGTFTKSSVDPSEVERLMQAIQPRGTAEVTTSLGWAAFHQGQLKSALALGEKAQLEDPHNIKAQVLQGYVNIRLERIEDAQHNWEKLRVLFGDKSRP